MIAIINYGVGNLFSLASSLRVLGLEAAVTAREADLRDADRIILPGVGAFGDAAAKLRATGLVPVVRELAAEGKPLLGICLGMQLLFERGYEYGCHEGLGLIEGEVVPLADEFCARGLRLKVPHIGWNSLELKQPENPLMKYTKQGDFVYYVHSYYAVHCAKNTVATSEYGVDITGAVARGNVFGCQFHPEKSGKAGLRILKAFSEV